MLPVQSVKLSAGSTVFSTKMSDSANEVSDLNFGFAVAERPSVVVANRELLSTFVAKPVIFVEQVHGVDILAVTSESSYSSEELVSQNSAIADAIILVGSEYAVAIQTADCLPVVIVAKDQALGAVIHAGRVGTENGIVERVVSELLSTGAKPESLLAYLAPAICGDCYEVPRQMQTSFANQVAFQQPETRWQTAAIDLNATVAAQLSRMGIASIKTSLFCMFIKHFSLISFCNIVSGYCSKYSCASYFISDKETLFNSSSTKILLNEIHFLQ